MSEVDETELGELLEAQTKSLDAHKKKLDDAYKGLDGRVEKLQEDIETRGKETGESIEAFKETEAKVITLEDDLKAAAQALDEIKSGGGSPEAHKTLADCAIEFLEKSGGYKGGNVVLVNDFEGSMFSRKTVSDAAGSAGSLLEPDIQPGIIADPVRTLSIRQLLTAIPTNRDSIKFYREDVFTNAAASQAGQGALKAESNITFTADSTDIETIAHWIPITDQILADVPALRAYIEKRMRDGLAKVEEDQILDGDGTNNTLLGIRPQATAFDVSLKVAGDTFLDTLRRSALQVSLAEYEATGFVVSPQDWCDIELTKTDDKAYVFTNPVTGAGPRLWGRSVAVSKAFSPNQFMTGAFAQAATLWDREVVSVKVFDQHADFAARNMLMLRVEERVGLSVERPKAFVAGAFA